MPSPTSEAAPSTTRPGRRLTVTHVALVLPWVMAVIAARLPVRDNSFLWHVTAGRMQEAAGSVLTTDPFSFTFLGQPWRTQSWLADVAYGWLDHHFGLGSVGPMLAVTALVTFAFVLLAVWRATRSLEAVALSGVMAAWLSAVFLNPRPVLFSYLLLAVVVVAAGERRLRWTLPLIAWIWAAVHGSFILGIGYVVLDGLRRRDRSAVTDTIAMTAAATLTAHGIAVWGILLRFLASSSALDLITEWRTPDFTGAALAPFLVGIVLLIVAAMRQSIRPRDLWVLIPFLVFGFTATRAVWPAWIPLAPMVALSLESVPKASRGSSVTGAALAVVMVGVAALPFLVPVKGKLSEQFPIDAVGALENVPTFHDDVVGGYLIYRLGPDFKVFVDDRAELYGADHLRSVITARSGAPDWRETFDRWSISQALLREDDVLVEVLDNAGWRETFRDDDFVVLVAP